MKRTQLKTNTQPALAELYNVLIVYIYTARRTMTKVWEERCTFIQSMKQTRHACSLGGLCGEKGILSQVVQDRVVSTINMSMAACRI
jgi:hypothetical protein